MQLALHIRVMEMKESEKHNIQTAALVHKAKRFPPQKVFTSNLLITFSFPHMQHKLLSIPILTVSRIGQFMHGECPTVINPHLDTQSLKTSAFQLCSSYISAAQEVSEANQMLLEVE